MSTEVNCTLTKEQILEAAKAGPEVKKALEKLFPKVFNSYFRFPNPEHVLNTYQGPLFINKGLWSAERDNCLVVDKSYKMDVVEREGDTFLFFTLRTSKGC